MTAPVAKLIATGCHPPPESLKHCPQGLLPTVTDSRSRLVAVTANNLRSYQPLANRASQPFSVMPKTGTIPASEEP
jgi:uncharacterized lipoprotein YajG